MQDNYKIHTKTSILEVQYKIFVHGLLIFNEK